MRNTIAIALIATTTLIAAVPDAEAMRRGGRGGDNAISESRAKLKAEWTRARARHGGEDVNPFAAALGLFGGEEATVTAKQPAPRAATKTLRPAGPPIPTPRPIRFGPTER
ncbi:MAG: hypothetical protein AAGG06_08200 [Pseudomonadota bacterium]